ncbi:hypothetical protein L226DRAFT_573428 [Lentinus tigrinus ALCF2SS1-7]|uniref:F-box domain-containing protein n=1 Tax=Lentinus tigrinus ALCF2SS1-6 TaxID=1328759 RepID=A0A5C2S7T0_9APHY|nr:hypothetical protein L227DRAFT_613712 [Lentinus tigrinus ALCF2SS1-6]RPD72068.1 hypothetical protein L226DRAFT_573428 [Lentinus tigrinus ALCF2SS1-7]
MQPATRFALDCPDVLEEIFGWLRVCDFMVHYERHTLRKALYSAALVCRAFSQHALDSLWHTLDKVHPLLALLPPFQYKHSCMFSREVTPEEWQRFELYARRVQTLQYGSGYEIRIHPSAWTYLLSPRQVCGRIVGPVLVLPGPALRHLSISFACGVLYPSFESAIPIFAMALDAIAALSPDLYTLQFDHSFYLNFANPVPSQISVPSGPSLLFFPSLRTFELAVKEIPADFVAAPGGLRSLQELKVCGTSGDVNNFIRGIKLGRLHAVEVISWRCAEFEEGGPPPHLSYICHNLPSASLRSLELNLDISALASSPCALSAIVEAMRPLTNLTAFALHGGLKWIRISDESIRTLGEACPRLRSLKVTQYRSPSDTGSVSLAVLREIARFCPALESLSMRRLQAAECLPQETGFPLASHGLRSLQFQDVVGASKPS